MKDSLLKEQLRQTITIKKDGKRLFTDNAYIPIGAEIVLQEGFAMKKVAFGEWTEREVTQDELDSLKKLSENYSSPE